MKHLFIFRAFLALSLIIVLVTDAYAQKQQETDRLVRVAKGQYMLGDQFLEQAQYEQYLQKNCPMAYKNLCKYNDNWKTGWILAGVGISTTVIGSVVYFVGLFMEELPAAICGGVLLLAGDILATASIPVLIISGIKRNRVPDFYNQVCGRQKSSMSLNFQAVGNGVGLALKF